jgi:magnesium-transporting ATPase (P-type)
MSPSPVEISTWRWAGSSAFFNHYINTKGGIKKKANNDDFEAVSTLYLNEHLGEFASEGLRTLVLGVRVISESYGAEWLSRYTAASSSITSREKKLVDGDKRETAIEIGYSTKVLTPSMSLFQVAADGSHGGMLLSEADRVRTLIASEFLRLVKTGKLPEYQKKIT